MTDRQRVIGFVLCIATILLTVLDTNIVSSAMDAFVASTDVAFWSATGVILLATGH
ncbi:hypothetical protein ACFWOJ_27255 [Streptomyces sp. NPDC058439]|uniref:hypothetical protein n=1 Tax=Streptomyces sp. NPDC058439 TaxID=3346500 RepID=UPI00364AF641